MASSMIELATDDLVSKLKSVIDPSIVSAYDIVDLMAQSKDVAPPFIGVVYAGMRRTGDDRSHGGIGQTMRFYLYTIAGGKEITLNSGSSSAEKHKAKVTETLDLIRKTVVDTVAPNNKKWMFAGEQPQDFGGGWVGFVQIWEVPTLIC